MIHRLALVAIALTLVVPGVLAMPAASVAIGPRGLVDPTREPYYLWARVSSPTVPHEASPDEDCADAAAQRRGVVEAARALVVPITQWRPLTHASMDAWFPGCVAAETSPACEPGTPCYGPPARGYASYDVGTGAYYVSASSSAAPVAEGKLALAIGGRSGVGILADCAACPEPP